MFLRDASVLGTQLDPHTPRIAVKDAEMNGRVLAVLAGVFHLTLRGG